MQGARPRAAQAYSTVRRGARGSAPRKSGRGRTRILPEPQGRRVDGTSFCCCLCLSLPGQTRLLNPSHRMVRPQQGAPARGGSGKDGPAQRGALRGQEMLVQSTGVVPCPRSLCFLGALCAAAVCFFFDCGYAAPGNSWQFKYFHAPGCPPDMKDCGELSIGRRHTRTAARR